MADGFSGFVKGIHIRPVAVSAVSAQGDMEVSSIDGKVYYHNGTTSSPMVTGAHSQILTNKTINGPDNTLTNISLTAAVAGTLPLGNGGTGSTSFTSGSIPFSNGTVLTQNNAAFYWDAGGARLNVAGGGGLTVTTGGVYINGFTTGVGLRIDQGTATGEIRFVSLYGNAMENAALALNLVDASNADLRFQVRGGGVLATAMTIYRDGKVGIGTTNPGSTLQVNGSTTIGGTAPGYLKLIGTAATRPFLVINNTAQTNGKYWYLADNMSGTPGTFEIYDNAAGARLVIDTSGKVGIGTESPTAKLDVVGGGLFSAGVTIFGNGGTVPGANRLAIDINVGATRLYAYGPNGTTPGSFEFHNIASDGDPDTPSVVIDTAGNVGIGTSSPLAKLHVEGLILGLKGTAQGLTIGDVTTNSNSVLRLQGTSVGFNWMVANNLNFGGLEITPSTATGGTTYSTPLVTLSGTTGFVGIGTGTAAPEAKLHVKATATGGDSEIMIDQQVVGAQAARFVGRKARNGGTVANVDSCLAIVNRVHDGTAYLDTAKIETVVKGTVATNSVPTDMVFYTGSASAIERMRIDSSGMVLVTGGTPGLNKILASGSNYSAAVSASGGTFTPTISSVNGSGIFLIMDASDGISALVYYYYSSGLTIVSQSGSEFAITTSPTSFQTGLQYLSSTGVLTVKNGFAVTRQYIVTVFGT